MAQTKTARYTPSDYGCAEISYQELDRFRTTHKGDKGERRKKESIKIKDHAESLAFKWLTAGMLFMACMITTTYIDMGCDLRREP